MLEATSSLGFLLEEVGTPVWFLLLLFGVPTGESLRFVRSFVRQKIPADPGKRD